MTDVEQLSKIIARHGLDGPAFRRSEHETDVELAARFIDIVCDMLKNGIPFNQYTFARRLEKSRIVREWRSGELHNED